MNKPLKVNKYGTGREDLLIKTPKNGLIKNNVLPNKVKDEIIIDSAMEDVLRLFWDNGIQTRGCCYGHMEDGKECVAFIDIAVKCFAKACLLAKEMQFDKPLGISCSYHEMVFFNQRDFNELGNWNIFPLKNYILLTSGE